jgi:hypothetical protein
MKIYRIASPQIYHYLGQCNKLRCDDIGENNWQNMIRNHRKVNCDELANVCDISDLVKEGETLEDFTASDPTSYCAKSIWGSRPCYYIMTCGFEFIFV